MRRRYSPIQRRDFLYPSAHVTASISLLLGLPFLVSLSILFLTTCFVNGRRASCYWDNCHNWWYKFIFFRRFLRFHFSINTRPPWISLNKLFSTTLIVVLRFCSLSIFLVPLGRLLLFSSPSLFLFMIFEVVLVDNSVLCIYLYFFFNRITIYSIIFSFISKSLFFDVFYR